MKDLKEGFSILILSAVCSLLSLAYIFYAVASEKSGVILVLAVAMLLSGIIMIIFGFGLIKCKINQKQNESLNEDKTDIDKTNIDITDDSEGK